MNKDIIVVSDFYNNPYDVRNAALQMDFDVSGNYPGKRTKPLTNEGTKAAIEECCGIKVTNWHDHLSGSFQCCSAYEESWIHSDFLNDFACIIYLTPDAPVGSGTSFYKHKASQSFGSKGVDDAMTNLKGEPITPPNPEDYSEKDYKWELVDTVGNVFNRMVIFNGSMWHRSMPYFGSTKESSRLFQLFFFDCK